MTPVAIIILIFLCASLIANAVLFIAAYYFMEAAVLACADILGHSDSRDGDPRKLFDIYLEKAVKKK